MSNRTLLVTDDAIVIRAMIKDAATEAGWTVVGEAANGQQAIDLYREFKPDAVTLDLIMPEFDGIHALGGILGDDPNAKVVVVSALNQKALLKKAFTLGASDFVCKPFEPEDLVQTLDRMVLANQPA